MSHPELSRDDLQVLRKQVLKKLGEVCAALEEVLANQEVDFATLPLLGQPDPEWTKIMRLRFYKDALNEVLESFADGTYGFCKKTQKPIPKAMLYENPWADHLPGTG